jgi:hypothetical protein
VGGLQLRPAFGLSGCEGAAQFGELEEVGLGARGERVGLGRVVVVEDSGRGGVRGQPGLDQGAAGGDVSDTGEVGLVGRTVHGATELVEKRTGGGRCDEAFGCGRQLLEEVVGGRGVADAGGVFGTPVGDDRPNVSRARASERARRVHCSRSLSSAPSAQNCWAATRAAGVWRTVRRRSTGAAGRSEKAQDGTHLLGVITASHLLHELLDASGALPTP